MPRSAAPRKAYRRRAINAPITHGLMAEFEDCFMTVETGLHLRIPTTEHFDALALLFNTIGPVAIEKFGERAPNGIAISLAAEAMNTAAERARAEGCMAPMTDDELAAISHGIDAAKAALPYLDVRGLAAQHRVVLRRIALERAINQSTQGATQ